MIAKCRIYNFKLSQYTCELDGYSETKLDLRRIFLRQPERGSSLNQEERDVVLVVKVYLKHPASATEIESLREDSQSLVFLERSPQGLIV